MKTLLISATDDGTGKTAIALALAAAAKDRGHAVGYMKPKGTRLQSHTGKTLDHDPMLARELLDLDAEIHDLEPVVYSPTFVDNAVRGHEDPTAIRSRVREAFDGLAADRGVMVLEGGGLSTGGVVDLTDPDVAELLDAETILIADFGRMEDLDVVLAAAETLGDRLEAVVFNRVRDADRDGLDQDAIPFLEARGIEVFGVVPYQRELGGVTVAQFADEIGADLLTSAGTDAFVERFLVGAMGSEEALRSFRRTRNAAVLTGGDRSEIHTAAIEASGVVCLVVTGGQRPSGAVLGAAEEAGVPVLAVRTDTLGAIERAEEVVRGGRTRDVEAVERMRELLETHADVDGLLD